MNEVFYDTDIKSRSDLVTRQKAGQYEWETLKRLAKGVKDD